MNAPVTTETVTQPEAAVVAEAVEKYAGFLEDGWEDAGVRGAATLIRVLGKYYELQRTEVERLRKALEMIYDKWEDGAPCYDDPEDCAGFMGNAVKLSESEEREILALIPTYCTKSTALDVAAPPVSDPSLPMCDCDQDTGCKEYKHTLFRCQNEEAERASSTRSTEP